MVKLAGTAASVCQAGVGGPHDALPSPWCAASTCRWIRPSGRRSQLCRAAVSAAVLHGRAVTSTTGSPNMLSPAPSPRVRRAQRTARRFPFSCGRTYGVCSSASVRR